MSTGFRGPLRYADDAGVQKLANPFPFLNDAPAWAVEPQSRLSVNQFEARAYGYSFNGANYPGPFVATAVTAGPGGFGLVGVGGTAANQAVLGGGVLLSSVTDNVSAAIVTQTVFQLVAGKRIWCAVRFSLAAAAEGAMLIGLVDAVPVDISAAIADIDGIYFHKLDAGTLSNFRVQNDTTVAAITSVDTAAGVGVLANGVAREYGFLVDATTGGPGSISAYVNGQLAGAIPSTSAARPDVLMSFAIVRQADASVPDTMSILNALCIEEL